MSHDIAAAPVHRRTERLCFVVTQNASGQWVAREQRGLIEGIFVSRRDAIRFALFETGCRASVIIGETAIPAKRAA